MVKNRLQCATFLARHSKGVIVSEQYQSADVLLVGAGTMSTTLAMLLTQLDPEIKIIIIEQLGEVAKESSDGWNNAGTGHAAYCELNYTPEQQDGSINTSKAFDINAAFEMSLQFWAYLVNESILPEPHNFINNAPHKSFVWGKKNVEFLRKRHQALSAHPMFSLMKFSEDPQEISKWMPLVMKGRDANEKVAATTMEIGCDVDFGSLTRNMMRHLQALPNVRLLLSHEVDGLWQTREKKWDVRVVNKIEKDEYDVTAKFVFLGAGGAALTMLQQSGIPEAAQYGGFPVSGQWLVCHKPEVVDQHFAKVYGLAAVGAPPMSVPHLDTRIIDGKKALLFGPFAGFTTKFLKTGSVFDLLMSIRPKNIIPMLSVARDNFDLTKYLIKEVLQSFDKRVETLKHYYPEVNKADWELAYAGQRVQVIKKDLNTGGKLQFGTEVVISQDKTIAALLGASPGASVAVKAMLEIVESCFASRFESDQWQEKIKKMIPSYGQSLIDDEALLAKTREYTLKSLNIVK
ncbi:malate dehydrogenase (quinone) [Marinicellulosiphila megalodicopiae]|uniref:malate dehydrogenase (quinone) n=1 Tax=Marinicellulosiphila megalodicopiae TaxID=2724896 RepID=UPI003BAEB5CB